MQIVVSFDCLSYNDDATSPAIDLLETKILINSTISELAQGACFLSSDLKDYFCAHQWHELSRCKFIYLNFHQM